LMAVLLGLSIFAGFILAVQWSNDHPDIGENKMSVSWLPSSATNISYYRSYSFTAYEFDMDERVFLRWASRSGLKEIKIPVEIERYAFGQLEEMPTGEYGDKRSKYYATVSSGLYYSDERSSGGGERIAYDRAKKRVYYQSNPR